MDYIKFDRSKRYVVEDPVHVGPECIGKVFRFPATDGLSDLRLGLSDFEDGGICAWHRHPTDQICIITEGECYCAAKDDEGNLTFEVVAKPGDVVIFKANELHIHGAQPGGECSHWAVSYKPLNP